ncbi:C-GCAxxG-C-C family protein [Novipirellula artificiosorum]|uniref:Split-Soret cytochrome c n=1 Tax=Novipirellula artificiosorum TaxID=2528016 RepID=A0A5C6DPU9_9BACT|nr:C-GCAxxG-C-C family protein [Novipirellula artificiosorum]TWU38204.1 Split-Soret cytochrome c precursor [Novipirellula artificiosorum]
MSQINRRRAFTSLGMIGGATLFAGCKEAGLGVATAQSPAVPLWNYVKLNSGEVADRTYRMYPEGGCMYSVVGGVLGALADKVGEPFRSFPIEMMRYGDGGVGGCGSLCGVINGGSALIGMFHNEKPKEQREAMIAELVVWYETTPLPHYKPAKPEWANDAIPSISGSILCHLSTGKWCEASGCEAFSMEKKERCRRLAADGASKLVELLNHDFDGVPILGELTPKVQSCIDCHGKQEMGNAMVKMNCASCHSFEGEHP